MKTKTGDKLSLAYVGTIKFLERAIENIISIEVDKGTHYKEIFQVCKAEIATSAKACPQCGAKNKKPIYTKWWVSFLLYVIKICFVLYFAISKIKIGFKVSLKAFGTGGRTRTDTGRPDGF